MASTARTHLRRRLGVLIAGAAILTALMTVTASASMPAVDAPAPGLTRPGTTTSITRTSNPSSTRPRTPIPGFLLDRGRITKFDALTAVTETRPNSINNRGQIAGSTLAPTEEDPLAGARGFLLAKGVKGPFTPIDVPGAPRNLVFGLNDHRALVGVYENTAATPSPQATGMGPLRLVRQGDLAAVVSDRPEDL